MTNDQIKQLASAIIDSANAQVAKLDMSKFGELSAPQQQIYDYQMGRVAVANTFLDFVASEESAATLISKLRSAA
ncbi:MAG TPA: hypothetical protein VNS29_04065 [Burkholderiaceae bacterium]|nr:hypothetical protein [Burkholderiaceae bacterium]